MAIAARSRDIHLIAVVAAIALCGGGVPAQAPPPVQYGISNLVSLGGPTSAAYDIAESGQVVVGGAETANGADHAFTQGYFGQRDLGTLGGAESTAFAVYSGVVVGQAQIASGQQRAFAANLMTNDVTNLGTLGGTWSAAYDTRYQITVGASKTTGDARTRAFQYVGGTMSAVALSPDLAGDSVAKGVNNSGDIVGYACTAANASCRPFLFSSGVTTMLGPTNRTGVANSINDQLEIAGSLTVAGSTALHAFFYGNASMIDLGTLPGDASSEGLAISEGGEVVGTSRASSGQQRAFLWRNGVMTDLNTLLPAASGWLLQVATSISDGGQIVGVGTLNGISRAFLLTPPTDLQVRVGGTISQHDSNLPRDGVEAGRRVEFTTSVTGNFSQSVAVYGAKMIHTLSGPARFEAVLRLTDGDSCELTPTVVTCQLPLVEANGLGREVQLSVRTTGIGPIAHHATVTSDVPDPVADNNSLSESNRAVALSSFMLAPATIAGGKISSANFVLTDRPPGGDAVLRLASSRPDIAPVPATFIIPGFTNKPTRTFNIVPAVVSSPTTVDITATYGLVTITRRLTVVPAVLKQIYLTPTTVIGGCGTSSGRILLTGTAPAGGGAVPLSNANARATVPSTVTVPAGADSTTFSVSTAPVTTPASGTVTARYGGVSQSLTLTVRPIRAQTLTLSPNRTRGGTTINATVVLECPAMPGPVAISLTSSNPAVASATVSSITLPAGATTGSFVVRTTGVSADTPVSIYAWVFGVRKSATLTVTP